MDENDAWKAAKWKHAISAASPILNSADVPFNVRDMFVGAAAVKDGKVRTNGFELGISKNLSDVEPA
eukprot:scaffold5210_cov106-Cylindrotheca_fusiformis.AAC.1